MMLKQCITIYFKNISSIQYIPYDSFIWCLCTQLQVAYAVHVWAMAIIAL